MEKFNESSPAFLAQRCLNIRGRYVVVAEYREGCKRDAVMVPKGKSSAEWRSMLKLCEELIHVLGESRRQKATAASSLFCNGVSFAKVMQVVH